MAERRTLNKRAVSLDVGGFPVADLTPPNRKREIQNSEAKSKLIKLVGGVAVFTLLASGAAFGFKLYNYSAYNSARAISASVDKQIEEQSVIDNMVTVYDSRKGAVALASAANLKWEDTYDRIQKATNDVPGSSITSIQIETGGTAEDAASSAVLVNINSTAPINYDTVYKAYGKIKGTVPGQIAVSSLGSKQEKGSDAKVFTYSVAMLLDSSFLVNSSVQDGTTAQTEPNSSSENTDNSFAELNDGEVSIKDLQKLRQDVADENSKTTGVN